MTYDNEINAFTFSCHIRLLKLPNVVRPINCPQTYMGKRVSEQTRKEIEHKWHYLCCQREYYATHQYFMSKRSIYLVLWKVTDGEKGVNEILQWLVSIQVRQFITSHSLRFITIGCVRGSFPVLCQNTFYTRDTFNFWLLIRSNIQNSVFHSYNMYRYIS